MKFTSSNIKFLKSWGFVVFTFLVVFRVVLWLSMEWPSNGGHLENPVVKIHNLPIHFMVFWPDSGRYWPSTPPEESLSILKNDPNIQNHLQQLFFLPIRLISDNPSHGVLAQNIISLMSAWMLFMILRSHGNVFASIVVFISFANLFTISMEYALLREVLSRFLLISLLYLLWRMFTSPSWNLALATGGILFLLPFGRQEMIIITVVITPVVFWRLSPRYAIVITLMGFLAAFTMIAWQKIYGGANIEGNVVNETSFGGETGDKEPLIYVRRDRSTSQRHTCETGDRGPFIYVLLLGSLLTDSYNYDSHVLKDLPKRIYDKAVLCKSMFKIDCQMPSIRYQHFEGVRRDVIKEWTKENGIDYEEGGMLGRVYWDILENNTKYVVYSAGYSLWSYLTSNLVTISPLIYAGDNPNYKFGWPYYASPRLTSFNDPLSEISLEERAPKWLLITLSPFSEYWVRRICAPFFLIGLFYIGGMFFLKREFLPPAERIFWLLTALWVSTILLVVSFIGWRLSRYVFPIDPFIFAISVLGAETVWKTPLDREISVKEKRLLQLVLLFLLIIIIGIPIYSRYNLSTLKRFIVEKRLTLKAKNATPENPVAEYTFPLVNPSFEIWDVNNISGRWSYAQNGSGGSVYKEVDARNIKFGSSSARVTRSNTGASQLYYTLSDEDAGQLRGKSILFGGWIKSANTACAKISLSVTSLGQCAPSSYYQNTGEWEFVYFWYPVPNDAKAFYLYFDVNSNANADAYFDGAILLAR